MTNRCRVSMIIPAWRAAATIGRAVESVLAQTIRPREVIVVDNNSPEDLEPALAPCRREITLCRQPDGGVSSACTTGIERACGDIAFLDADDYWEPLKIERQLQALETHPDVGFVGASLYLEEPGGWRYEDPALDRLLGRAAHARTVADVYSRWSTRLLAEGDGRGALAPALAHLTRAHGP